MSAEHRPIQVYKREGVVSVLPTSLLRAGVKVLDNISEGRFLPGPVRERAVGLADELQREAAQRSGLWGGD